MNMLRAALSKYPIVTNSILYGTLYVGAEFSQQTIARKLFVPRRNYDMKVLLNYSFLGTCVLGPTLCCWYRWLDKRFVGTTTNIIIKKLLLDQFILSPPMLSIFFVGMSFLEGKPDIFADCKEKFFSTFGASCSFWIPVQAINFKLVPPAFRVVYTGTCAFIWVNILCTIKRHIKTDKVMEKTKKDND